MFVSSLISTLLSVSVLTAPVPAASTSPTPPADDDGGAAAATAALTEVRELLEDVTSLLPGETPAADLTLALRDLALLKDDLPAILQPMAEGYLARPTDGNADQFRDGYTTEEETPVCSDVVCVHYVTTTSDAVPEGDSNDNDIPDYVDFALATMTQVHHAYVGAGYRAPRGDGERGGDAKPDVYLADVGAKSLYGYCATDEDFPASGPQNAWAYCVLDNDYRAKQFPVNSAQDNFRVTAAHEYFHAVQFGYDVSEDPWVMEATATWAEDEVFDAVNDNVQYLRYGPMRMPLRSMDQFEGLFHYGTWSFFRFLTEKFPASQGGMPVLVRDLWKQLDDRKGAPRTYSLQGVRKVLRSRGVSLRDAFADYSVANRMPNRYYDEAKAQHYPHAPLMRTVRLTPSKRSVGPIASKLDHLASRTTRFRPGNKLRAGDWRLQLVIDMDKRWKGSTARVTVKPRSGPPRTTKVALDRQGDARPRFGFSATKVKWVDVTLVNASHHYSCGEGTKYSCEGMPRFNASPHRLTGRISR